MQLRSGIILKSSLSMNHIPVQKTNMKNKNTHIYFNDDSCEDDVESTITTTDVSEYIYQSEDNNDTENDSDYNSESSLSFKVKTTRSFDNTHPKYEEWFVKEILKRLDLINIQTTLIDKLRLLGEMIYILDEEFEFIYKMPNVTNVMFDKYKELLEDIPRLVLSQLTPKEIKENSIFIFDIQNEMIKFNNRIQETY